MHRRWDLRADEELALDSIGAVVGVACGSIFGLAYAVAGLGIGVVAGIGIMIGMR